MSRKPPERSRDPVLVWKRRYEAAQANLDRVAAERDALELRIHGRVLSPAERYACGAGSAHNVCKRPKGHAGYHQDKHGWRWQD